VIIKNNRNNMRWNKWYRKIQIYQFRRRTKI